MINTFREWVLPSTKNQAKIEEEKPKDVYLVPFLDMHTGSTMALFPYYDGRDMGFPPHEKMLGNGEWRFKHRDYRPTARQYRMFEHFRRCAEVISEERKGRQLVLVEVGDSIDGDHHHTPQLATANLDEQKAVHVWLMQYFMSKVGFNKEAGDLLYIGAGTESHTGENEDTISVMLGANKLPDGGDVFDFLPMSIKGKMFWFLHQGASAGSGINRGNSAVNWMRTKYIECLEDGRVIPDVIVSGHYHKPTRATWTQNYHTMEYIIAPPFQLKTRFGYRVAAAELDKVGLQTIVIGDDGNIKINKPILLKEFPETVVIT